MRKLFVIALCSAMALAIIAAPAGAAKRKKAKPVETTMYMHGNYPVGDFVEWVGNVNEGTLMMMDGQEPTDSYPKSFSWGYLFNESCTGNQLYPSWQGNMSGTITGDMKWTANTFSGPAKVLARLWVDIPFSSCTSSAAGVNDFKEPVASTVVDVPPGPGEVEIVFEKLKLPVLSHIIVMLSPDRSPQQQGRVLYDSPQFPTRLEFSCIPASGKTCLTE